MRRRALVISNLFPMPGSPNRGAFNRQHYTALQEHMDVDVLCPIAWVDRVKQASIAGEPASGKLNIRYTTYLYPPRIMRRHYGRFLWHSIRRSASAMVRQLKPDVVVGSWGYPDGYAAVELAHQFSLPCAVQILGSDINQLDIFPERAAPTWETLRRADRILPVSHALRDRIIEGGVAAERLSVVYRGIDRSLFFPMEQEAAKQRLGLRTEERVLLFIGNLVPVKSIHTLIAAAAKLFRASSDTFRLHIVGNGPLREALQEQAIKEQIGERVSFEGTRPHAEMPAWINAADLVLLPSLHEGVPNVLLESIACGRPYVASHTGGIPEISRHAGCRLFPPGDVDAMFSAMEAMLESDQLPELSDLPTASWEEAGANLASALNAAIDHRQQAA